MMAAAEEVKTEPVKTEEQKTATSATPQTTLQEQGRDFWDVLGDMGANAIDKFAETGRLSGALGGALQGAFNTPGYQMQKAKFADAYAKMQREQENHDLSVKSKQQMLAVNEKELAEYDKNAELREKQRKQQLLHADLMYKQDQMRIIEQNVAQSLQALPAWGQLDEASRKQLTDSTAAKYLEDATFYGRELLKSRNSTDDWDRVQRIMGYNGVQVHDDGYGGYSVSFGDKSLPLNEESGMQVYQGLQDAVAKEADALLSIQNSSVKGNVNGKIYADYTKALMPYFKGAANAGDEVIRLVQQIPESDRVRMNIVRTMDDYFSGDITDQEKMAELEMLLAQDMYGMSMLDRAGLEYLPGREGIADAQILDRNTGKKMPLMQYYMEMRNNNPGQKMLDSYVETVKKRTEESDKVRMAKEMAKAQAGDGVFGGEDNAVRRRALSELSAEGNESPLQHEIEEKENAIYDDIATRRQAAFLKQTYGRNYANMDDTKKQSVLNFMLDEYGSKMSALLVDNPENGRKGMRTLFGEFGEAIEKYQKTKSEQDRNSAFKAAETIVQTLEPLDKEWNEYAKEQGISLPSPMSAYIDSAKSFYYEVLRDEYGEKAKKLKSVLSNDEKAYQEHRRKTHEAKNGEWLSASRREGDAFKRMQNTADKIARANKFSEDNERRRKEAAERAAKSQSMRLPSSKK